MRGCCVLPFTTSHTNPPAHLPAPPTQNVGICCCCAGRCCLYLQAPFWRTDAGVHRGTERPLTAAFPRRGGQRGSGLGAPFLIIDLKMFTFFKFFCFFFHIYLSIHQSALVGRRTDQLCCCAFLFCVQLLTMLCYSTTLLRVLICHGHEPPHCAPHFLFLRRQMQVSIEAQSVFSSTQEGAGMGWDGKCS